MDIYTYKYMDIYIYIIYGHEDTNKAGRLGHTHSTVDDPSNCTVAALLQHCCSTRSCCCTPSKALCRQRGSRQHLSSVKAQRLKAAPERTRRPLYHDISLLTCWCIFVYITDLLVYIATPIVCPEPKDRGVSNSRHP